MLGRIIWLVVSVTFGSHFNPRSSAVSTLSVSSMARAKPANCQVSCSSCQHGKLWQSKPGNNLWWKIESKWLELKRFPEIPQYNNEMQKIFSKKSLSKWNHKISFGICSSRGPWNTPYLIIFILSSSGPGLMSISSSITNLNVKFIFKVWPGPGAWSSKGQGFLKKKVHLVSLFSRESDTWIRITNFLS